jgi:hypothetical protein
VKEITHSSVSGVPAGGEIRDSIERKNFWWKALAVAPCLVLGAPNALRISQDFPGLHALQSVVWFVDYNLWGTFPFFGIYVLAVAVVFLHRRETGWTAVAFLALGLSLPECVRYGWAELEQFLKFI